MATSHNELGVPARDINPIAVRPNYMGPVDIFENDHDFVFKADCPGLTAKEVSVKVKDGSLQISGSREAEKESEGGSSYHRSERTHGSFCRTFKLPDNVNYAGISATCESGVLTIIVPKLEKSESHAPEAALAHTEDAEGDGSLNDEFSSVPISVFPTPAIGKLVVIDSSTSLLDAVKILSDNRILSAPVRDVRQADDAPWHEKYLGMVDMVSVVLHMLNVLEPAGMDPADFQKEIEACEAFRTTTVADAVEHSALGPFVPVEYDRGTLLDCMLLCGQHAIRRVPIVKTPGGDLANIITQSALIQTLAANLDRFQSVARKTLRELGMGTPARVWKVTKDQPLKRAFLMIRDYNISAVPIVDEHGAIRGNVSARDVRLIVQSSKIYKLLNMPLRVYLDVVSEGVENSAITCSPDDTLEEIIRRMVASRIHRIYVVDEKNRPIRVISLRNVLRKFVKEPNGYFGHFFLG